MAETNQLLWELMPVHLQTMPGLHKVLAALEQHNVPKGIATSGSRTYLTRVIETTQALGSVPVPPDVE